jgi:8-oxo-dGTP pyrophosphatase MutT (NUDIX family)
MKLVNKVGLFVIRNRRGSRAELLLFTHLDYPEAPIQIPGGTIEPGEQADAAASRELHEESGIASLPLIRQLGISLVESTVDPDVTLRRHCYLYDGTDLPDHWVHHVTGDGEDQDLRFAYRWHAIDRDFHLSGDLDYFLNAEAIPELYQQ